MNVLGISGTPRRDGNSEILLQYALRPFKDRGWEIRHHRLREMEVRPCRACDACKDHGQCTIGDDMHKIYEAFRWCDAIILSTPVYSRNVCSQMLAVLDRHYAVSVERPLAGKVGGAMAVGRGSCGGQAIAVCTLYNWMLSCGVVCVPGELNGVTAVASEPGDILKQDNRLRQAQVLGSNVAFVTEKLRSGPQPPGR